MAENTVSTAATPKAKSKPVAVAAPAFEMPKFEIPKFEMPKFEMPKFEVPTAFREIAEKGIAQAKENYEKVKSAAEQATDVLEETYSTASKGCASYGLKLVETTRANSDAAALRDHDAPGPEPVESGSPPPEAESPARVCWSQYSPVAWCLPVFERSRFACQMCPRPG